MRAASRSWNTEVPNPSLSSSPGDGYVDGLLPCPEEKAPLLSTLHPAVHWKWVLWAPWLESQSTCMCEHPPWRTHVPSCVLDGSRVWQVDTWPRTLLESIRHQNERAQILMGSRGNFFFLKAKLKKKPHNSQDHLLKVYWTEQRLNIQIQAIRSIWGLGPTSHVQKVSKTTQITNLLIVLGRPPAWTRTSLLLCGAMCAHESTPAL